MLSAAPLIAWSHSRVKTYKDCPKMFYMQNISKEVKYEQGAPQAEGERVHKVLENRLTHRIPLAGKDVKHERLMQVIEALPGTTYGERDYALDVNLKPCGYFDKGCFVRVTIDVTNINPAKREGWLIDYKNGKVTLDEDQLKLYAAVMFVFFPEIDTWHTKYVFLEYGVMDGKTYTRDQFPELWRELLIWPSAMQRAAVTNDWRAKPSKKCAWCTVNKYGKCSEAAERYRGS